MGKESLPLAHTLLQQLEAEVGEQAEKNELLRATFVNLQGKIESIRTLVESSLKKPRKKSASDVTREITFGIRDVPSVDNLSEESKELADIFQHPKGAYRHTLAAIQPELWELQAVENIMISSCYGFRNERAQMVTLHQLVRARGNPISLPDMRANTGYSMQHLYQQIHSLCKETHWSRWNIGSQGKESEKSFYLSEAPALSDEEIAATPEKLRAFLFSRFRDTYSSDIQTDPRTLFSSRFWKFCSYLGERVSSGQREFTEENLPDNEIIVHDRIRILSRIFHIPRYRISEMLQISNSWDDESAEEE